jgi:hypothetical protein
LPGTSAKPFLRTREQRGHVCDDRCCCGSSRSTWHPASAALMQRTLRNDPGAVSEIARLRPAFAFTFVGWRAPCLAFCDRSPDRAIGLSKRLSAIVARPHANVLIFAKALPMRDAMAWRRAVGRSATPKLCRHTRGRQPCKIDRNGCGGSSYRCRDQTKR